VEGLVFTVAYNDIVSKLKLIFFLTVKHMKNQ